MRKLVKFIAVSLMLMCLFFMALFMAMNSPFVQKYIQKFAEQSLSKNIGYQVKFENLRVNLPLNIEADHLTVNDSKGQWLEAKNIKTKLLPFSLLPNQQIIIPSLDALELKWLYIPEKPIKNNQNDDASETSLVIGEIEIPHLEISQSIISSDSEIILSLRGGLEYSNDELKFSVNSQILNDFNPLLEEGDCTVAGNFNIGNNALNIRQLQIDTSIFNLKGMTSVDFEKQLIDGKYDLECKELARIISPIQGSLKSNLTISGSFKKPVLTSTLDITSLKYEKYQLPNLTLNNSFEYDSEERKGNIQIRDSQNHFKINTSIVDLTDLIELNSIEIISIDHQLVGNLSYIKKYNNLNGVIDLKSTNFDLLADIAGTNIQGQGNLKFKLSSEHNIQKIDIDGQLENLLVGNYNASLVDIKVDIADLNNFKLKGATIEIQNANYENEYLLDHTKLEVDTVNDKSNFNLSIKAPSYNNSKLSVIGDIKRSSYDQIELNLTKIDGIYNKSILSSSKTITINYKGQKLNYDFPDINFDKGKIIIHGLLDKNEIDSKIIFKSLPFTLIDLNLPNEFAKAILSGDCELKGKVSSPEIISKLQISNISFTPEELSSIFLEAKYKDNNFVLSSSIKNSNSMHGNFNLTLPGELSILPTKLLINKDKKIEGDIKLNLKIDSLAALFLPPIHRFKGNLTSNMKLKGDLNNPKVVGMSYISDGKYEFVPGGVKIKNITASFEAAGQKINIREFSAFDDEKKVIKAEGSLSLSQKNRPFNLNLSSNGFYFLNHPNIQSAAKLDIKIKGDIDSSKIVGTIEPTSLEIQIPEQFKKEIIELNITKVITNNERDNKSDNKEFFNNYKVSLDVLIKANRKIFIRGWGVDAELGGEIKCKGLMGDPNIKGELKTIHGRYQEFGKQLTIKEGSLTFNGSIPPSPYLNIVGSAVQDNIEIQLILAGPLLKPSLSIESNPSMPKDEALSILLFGKQSAQISPFQGIQLADSLRRLSGRGGPSMNVLGRARDLLKVDDIKIKNSGSDARDAALGIGKYLTDKIYLEIEKGAQEGSGKTKVEVEIKNNLSIESSVGESGANSVGINWHYDY